MNLSKRDQSLLIVLAGLAVVLAAYFGIYRNFGAKADAAKAECASLQPQLEQRREYYNNLPEYEKGIEDISSQVEKDIKSFPSDVRSEDMINYGTQLESDLGLSVTDMSFSAPTLVSQFSIPEKGSDDSTTLVPYAALSTQMDVSIGMSYAQMLDFIDYIYNSSAHTTLESITVNYNSETGKLSGSATLLKYFMSDSEYTYEETQLPTYSQGTTNPFGAGSSANTTGSSTSGSGNRVSSNAGSSAIKTSN